MASLVSKLQAGQTARCVHGCPENIVVQKEDPTSRKTLGTILVVLGVVLLAVGLFADSFGLGSKAGMGWKQIAASVAGVIALVVGAWFAMRKAA